MDLIDFSHREQLAAILHAHEGACVAAMVAEMRAAPEFQGWERAPDVVIAEAVRELIGALTGTLLLGTTAPLVGLAQWHAELMRHRAVLAPRQSTLQFIQLFAGVAQRTLPFNEQTGPVAARLFSDLQTAFAGAYTADEP